MSGYCCVIVISYVKNRFLSMIIIENGLEITKCMNGNQEIGRV